jgi:hypothetical protein
MTVGVPISPNPTMMRAHRKVLETVCTTCQSPFQLAEEVYQCPACVGYHHLGCWDMTRGCPGQNGAPAAHATTAAEPPRAAALVPEPAVVQATETSVRCPECALIHPASALHCDCGHVFRLETNKNLAEDERLCPVCAEVIKAKALKCRFCGHVLDSRLVDKNSDVPRPHPPSLNWGLVLVLSLVTLGVFSWLWLIRISIWARKVNRSSYSLVFCVLAPITFLVQSLIEGISPESGINALLSLIGLAFVQIGQFSLRSTIQEYYNTPIPGQLELSRVMTFFFGAIYFQYHFNRLGESKQSNVTGL